MSTLKSKIKGFTKCKTLFTDFFDTLVHRTVHPNYTLKLWGKFLVRELGIKSSGDALFAIRLEALDFLRKKQRLASVEVDYTDLIEEVYKRLVNTDNLPDTTFEHFRAIFEKADYNAEISVQFKNEKLISELASFQQKGYQIYLISDFYLSKEIISNILDFHQISYLFEDVFVSSSLGKSKENGSIYPYVLKQTNSKADTVLMMGDNKKSDVENAIENGINAIHLKHTSHKLRNKRNLFGKDVHDFKNACQDIEVRCKKSEHAFSEYILHFYFFTERLYLNAKRKGIKDLFFLAREGLYLKRLFDCYQEMNQLKSETKIHTHYLKVSRQSATQVAFKPLAEEDFRQFKGRFGKMSLENFIDWFNFSDTIKAQIINELGEGNSAKTYDFFKSETEQLLRKNVTFQEAYEKNRKNQKRAFENYLDSFGVNFEKEGINLVDVGWGGTMQESLYLFLKKKVPVTGYYLGLKEVYNIEKDTKRYGLNFSIYPSHSFSDDILKANGQLYEQLLAAPHGSTLSYTLVDEKPKPVEFHEEKEKWVFDNFVETIQEYMFLQFKDLFNKLRPINYTQDMVQDYLTDMALRNGILTSKQKIEFINKISKGFYQNVGENKIGLAYDPKQLKGTKFTLFKRFFVSPEKVFRYLVKIKPFMYAKGIYWLSWPVNLAYYYIKFNSWFKRRWLNKGLVR